MPLLDFAKPQKLRSSGEHADIHASDSGVITATFDQFDEIQAFVSEARAVLEGSSAKDVGV